MAYAELTLDQGTTFETSIELTRDDGTPINVAGYAISSQVRKSFYSTNATANLVCTIFDAANGNVTLSLDSANTSNIKPGRYVYDLRMTTTANITTRVLEGIITVTPSVTK